MDEVRRVIKDVNSPMYNSTNWEEIKKYLWLKGVEVEKESILRELEKEKINTVKFKNKGLQKIAQLGRPYALRQRFFSSLQADTCILSAKRKYGARSPYILVVICQLTRYIFLESPTSLKFAHQQRAWEKIFSRMEDVLPGHTVSTLTTDSGIEFGLRLKSWMNSKGIRLNNVRLRPFRESRGAPAVEAANRRFRSNLEKQMIKRRKKMTFSDVLMKVEERCNRQFLSSLGMSAVVALQHTPGYIAMKSESVKYKKRNYLREAILKKQEIELFSIVRIKKFQEKIFKSSRKESYGFLSPNFLVTSIIRDRVLPSYKLSNLFTLLPLPASYTRDEMVVSKLSYIDACKFEERNVVDVLKLKKDIIEYSILASDRSFLAGKNLLNDF